ncbi:MULTISPECIES: hypothetical protein [unclassified Mesorhizobium]|uniref:hypothetical protein n=1 Tax=unclassified Mesorhizobium TaxID=325217 RepID=UPI0011281A7E|nr:MULTISPECIES: hypothetical protein [unclassified Mesorhizobium]TPJ50630.1 hypothetical protein FJ426_24575 [Mesorhizobium sp. B2-6-4]TPM14018.1 hypothetical protein FJ953_26850 [Mesorhizobium sp. B2-3-6]
MLDDKPFDLEEILGVERELSGLTAAEGEQMRRQRMEAAAAGQARIDALKEKLERRNTERLEAVERAEKAAIDLREASKQWIAANGDCAGLVRALNQTGGAGILDPHETEVRLSHMLTCALKPLFGLRRKLGMIVFPDAWSRFAGSWKEAEQSITEHEILAALKGADRK